MSGDIVAVLRMWLDVPDLKVTYERRGITIITIAFRMEAAKVTVAKINEILLAYDAVGAGDPGRMSALYEILDMARVALNGGPGQVLPLTGEIASPLDDLFGEVS